MYNAIDRVISLLEMADAADENSSQRRAIYCRRNFHDERLRQKRGRKKRRREREREARNAVTGSCK